MIFSEDVTERKRVEHERETVVRLARFRARCHGAQFETVGLFALRAGGATVGLLQVNDRRRGRLPPGTLLLLERLADSLAIGIVHRMGVSERAVR